MNTTLHQDSNTRYLGKTAVITGGTIGMGYVHHNDGVDAAFIAEGKFEIGVALKRFAAEASLSPMYDPKSALMRA